MIQAAATAKAETASRPLARSMQYRYVVPPTTSVFDVYVRALAPERSKTNRVPLPPPNEAMSDESKENLNFQARVPPVLARSCLEHFKPLGHAVVAFRAACEPIPRPSPAREPGRLSLAGRPRGSSPDISSRSKNRRQAVPAPAPAATAAAVESVAASSRGSRGCPGGDRERDPG